MGITTNYDGINDDYGILPEGVYEVIIRNIEERTTKSGATGLSISLVVRNDVEQKYKDRYINLWKRKEPTEDDKKVQGYSFKQIMRLAKSARLPNGKSYETVMELCGDLLRKPIRVDLEHREYNGKLQENVKFVNASDYPECKHAFKKKKDVSAPDEKAESGFTSAAVPPQPDNLSLGSLDDFEEILSDGDVPF